MEHKTVELLETKADDSGSFVALASVFGNVDSVGDRMMPGAFSRTLEEKRDAGKPIPVVFSHGWEDPFNYIGKADPHKVVETEKGLEVHGKLDLSNPTAKQVHGLMRDGTITGWSFGYTVPKGGQERKNGANEVSEVDLIEVGPTLRGANSEAQLQAVKAALEERGAEVEVSATAETNLSPAAPEGVEDQTVEEPAKAKSGRQDPLADTTEEWWMDVFGP